MSKILNQLTDIACRAGDEIMRIYGDMAQSGHVDYKADNSPLTLADRRSHEIIAESLSLQFPSIPILSEEGASVEYSTRKQWPTYWLIDPLDGTKEFINRNGEFTVNIALVEQQCPVLGVVYAPALDKAFCGSRETGAYVVENGAVSVLRVNDRTSHRIAVRSKSHASPEEDAVLAKYNVADCISIGSSLKFCLVAEGKADVYYRHGPTMEWDVAAGQAVVQAAGGKVYAGVGPDEFLLNKENLLNGSFLCLGGDYYQA